MKHSSANKGNGKIKSSFRKGTKEWSSLERIIIKKSHSMNIAHVKYIKLGCRKNNYLNYIIH